MRIIDFYPSQGSFAFGESVIFLVELEASVSQDVTLRIFIRHLSDQPVVIEKTFQMASGEQTVPGKGRHAAAYIESGQAAAVQEEAVDRNHD